MFVSENPNEDDDLAGRTFDGQPGKLFDFFIDDLALEAWYVTNIVMCKPNGKEKPKAEHWNACKERLLHEIRIIDPVIIVAMGGLAIKALIGGTQTSVVKARKQIHTIDVPGELVSYMKPVVATYHPAGVQRKAQINPGSIFEAMMRTMIEAKQVAYLWLKFAAKKNKKG